MTYDNYLGEGDINGKFRLYWQVRDKYEQHPVMVTCMSNQLFPPEAGFDRTTPGRPIRIILTVFFISMDHFNCEKKYGSINLKESK